MCGGVVPAAAAAAGAGAAARPRARALLATLVAGALLAARAGALLPLGAEELRATVGGFAVMNCHLDFPFGNEIPYHLQWDKDGETIYSWYSGGAGEAVASAWSGRVRRVLAPGLGRGSVNVTAVRETDAGLFRCRVAFPNRTPPARNNGTFYYLHVDGGNLIATPPVNATVLEGERAELECRPKSAEYEIEWLKDGTPLAALAELAARAERPANGSLVLRAATSADLGEYTCRVRAPDGQLHSAAAFLDVHYKAKVVYAPSERFLPFGKPASLDCHFSANPPLTNLRWEKDGFLFDPYNVPGVFYSRNGSLLFNRVEDAHEGDYSCTPYNALGSGGSSARVRVRVLRPPQLRAAPPPLVLAPRGAAITLPCVPEHQEHPIEIIWTKDGGELSGAHVSLSGGNLTLSRVSAADAGVYVCAVRSAAGEARAECRLRVEPRADPHPHDLRATPTRGGVLLTWTPGAGGSGASAGSEFAVWYRARGSAAWQSWRAGAGRAALAGLRARTQYELRVLQQDARGDGLFSRPLIVTTLDDSEPAEEVTEGAIEMGTMEPAEQMGPGPADDDGGAGEDEGEREAGEVGAAGGLRVWVRAIDGGVLLRWQGAGGGGGSGGGEGAGGGLEACTARWVRAGELLASLTTDQQYMLVNDVDDDEEYEARVWCAGGYGGAARWRGAARGSGGAALAAAGGAGLLLAGGATLYWLRARQLGDRRC